MLKTCLLFVVLATGLSAAAQAGHGTIVILDFAKDRMAIAADSRITFNDKPPDDSFCKIRVYRHRIVFAQMGSIGYIRGSNDPFPGWYNAPLAARAVREMGNPDKNPDDEIMDISGIWARSIALYWNRALQTNPDVVYRTAKPGGDIITGAVFAEARNGAVHWRTVFVGLNPTLKPPAVQAFTGELHDCFPCGEGEKVCAMARPVIPTEYCTQSSVRAKDETSHWNPAPELENWVSRETLHAVRLADLTIAFDPVGNLGGKIDTVELHNDGTIQWVFRKPGCPDNED
ncbi:MAG TPA: hypothetical protein VND65_11955 [Candidatus Binatia bacterium]|nr:hypothetical protein [Candidatus Binatia bacterium]